MTRNSKKESPAMVDASNSAGSHSTEKVTVSIVSHGHGALVEQLIEQVLKQSGVAKVLLTLNVPENLALPSSNKLVLVHNTNPKGFGASHNAAFRQCDSEFFCVLNPDIVLSQPIFGGLIEGLLTAGAVLAAPAVISTSGEREDSWRQFPTLGGLLLKAIGKDNSVVSFDPKADLVFPAWVAGMCLLFDTQAYQRLGGFDEGYFLYYEDVDICARIWKEGFRLVACPNIKVTHDAQRASRRNSQHMRWHALSMARYFIKFAGRLPAINRT
jgi:N-acetylglucosaminyl-diphospho-decaprenol L-rhamnosyltransferase